MNSSGDRIAFIAVILVIASIVGPILYIHSELRSSCAEAGGVYARTAFGFECVRRQQ